MVGHFQAPLHDAPMFATIYPNYSMSLEDPYIYDVLKSYNYHVRFDKYVDSWMIQIKCKNVLWF